MQLLYGKSIKNADVLFEGTEKECRAKLMEHLREKDIKGFYQRYWMDNDGIIVIDYGSWSTFFFLKN